MGSTNSETPTSPKSVLDLLKDWKELITFVALTLTSGLSGIFGGEHPTLQKVSWVLAVVFVAVGAYVIHRKQKRKLEQERREKIWAESEAQRKAGSAFRSLAPFEERDKLPGKDRKVEARVIATRIASDDFRFGVVCGDTGCGKTSMLRSEITRVLREARFEVAYVRNPRRLETKASEALPPKERLASELKALLKNYVKPTTEVVILDQFEEWFIEYQEPEQRLQIGSFLRKLGERSQRMRIICAIRREFLIDFDGFSDDLPQQLSTANRFHIKNFTVEQAKDVINECATADGLALDDSFAETVAHDLVEGGQVRPPELQIVCTYLAVSGDLNTPKYRQAGGTAGILAHYIKVALDDSKERAVAARILRALCDFPTHTKQKGKTLDELTATVNTSGATLRKTVEGIVSNFVLGRILAAEQGANGEVFSLIHDYLVEPIQLATANESTKTEEANQLLRFYVAEKRGTIPLGRLRDIRKFADRRLRQEPAARRLIRRSIFVPILRSGITVAVALALALGLYVFATARLEWRPQVIARHPSSEGLDGVKVDRLEVKGRIATGADSKHKFYQIWDAKIGKVLNSFPVAERTKPIPSRSLKFLMLEGSLVEPTSASTLIDLSSMSQTVLSESAAFFAFSESENELTWTSYSASEYGPVTDVVYSVVDKRIIRSFGGFNGRGSTQMVGSDRILLAFEENGQAGTALFDIHSGKLIAKLRQDEEGELRVTRASVLSSRICAVYLLPDRSALLSFWDLNGNPKGKYHFDAKESVYEARLEFTADGSSIILMTYSRSAHNHKAELVLNVTTLQPTINVPADQLRSAVHRGSYIVFWKENDATNIFDAGTSATRRIDGMWVDAEDELLMSDDTTHAIVHRKQVAELWDLAKGRLVTVLRHSGVLKAANFAVDDTAAVLQEEGDVFSLFDLEKGELLTPSPIHMSAAKEIYYDRDCRRFHVWNDLGQVIRYTEGRDYLGKFVRTRSCD